jgi:Uma2 family endonuclease
MSERVLEHATYADLMQVPDNMVAELIDGELYTSPRPGRAHTNSASTLGMIIGPPFHLGRSGPGGWWIFDEPEVHFGKNVLVPDLAGWHRARLPITPENHVFDVVPDWVCEVISPSSGRLDRIKKMPIYAREGVPYAWIVDPVQQTLEAYRLVDDSWQLFATHCEDEVVRVAPFDAIEIELSLLWSAPAS